MSAGGDKARPCPWPTVLGIDPGTRVLGYGALVLRPEGPRLFLCGVIRAPAGAPVPDRLAHIQGELETLLDRVQPQVVAVERAFAGRNVQSALRLGEGRGVVLATAARAGADVFEYTPASAKKAVVGHGAASKEQIARMVAQRLGVPDLEVPHDATDALALALTHVRGIEQARLANAAGVTGGGSDLASGAPLPFNGGGASRA